MPCLCLSGCMFLCPLGMGDPAYFYVTCVFLLNGVMMSLFFIYGSYLRYLHFYPAFCPVMLWCLSVRRGCIFMVHLISQQSAVRARQKNRFAVCLLSLPKTWVLKISWRMTFLNQSDSLCLFYRASFNFFFSSGSRLGGIVTTMCFFFNHGEVSARHVLLSISVSQ